MVVLVLGYALGRKAYINGFLNNSTPALKWLQIKKYWIYFDKIWDLIRPGIRENDPPYTKSTLDEREMDQKQHGGKKRLY